MNAPVFSNLAEQSVFHDRYRVIRPIRAGNMGAVYEVVDQKTNTPRALKVMLPNLLEDADLRSRFEREAQVTGHISSDHLVKVTDAGIDPATSMPFLVMELLQGHELGSLVKKRGGLPAEDVVTFLFQAALALDKTHAAGIVHRDLKPENMFLTFRDDESPCIKLLDFGIAKLVAQNMARGGTRPMGTPHYMAPEQLRGDASIGPRTDIFALGHIAYTLLVGEPYWWEESVNADSIFPMLGKIIDGPREAPSVRVARRMPDRCLPASFDEWFFKTTATAPEGRFERATNAVRALSEALGVPLPRARLSTLSNEARGQANDPVMPAARASTTDKTTPLVTPSGTIVLDSMRVSPPTSAPEPECRKEELPTPPIAPAIGTAASLASSLPTIKQASTRRFQRPLAIVLGLLVAGVVATILFQKSGTQPDTTTSGATNTSASATSVPIASPIASTSATAAPIELPAASVAAPAKAPDAGEDAASSADEQKIVPEDGSSVTAVTPATAPTPLITTSKAVVPTRAAPTKQVVPTSKKWNREEL